MQSPVLIVPGIGNSGPEHWQTLWERSTPSFWRVTQRDWDRPVLSAWMTPLMQAISAMGPRTVIVAHSLGCLLVAHWAATSRLRIRAALLVAVPDPVADAFPKEAVGFAPVPTSRFSFPSIVVTSTNDIYGSAEHAQHCATQWGSRFVNIGPAGHINAASGLGDWPEGFSLLNELLA